MRAFDWAVVIAYISWIVIDGLQRARPGQKVKPEDGKIEPVAPAPSAAAPAGSAAAAQ